MLGPVFPTPTHQPLPIDLRLENRNGISADLLLVGVDVPLQRSGPCAIQAPSAGIDRSIPVDAVVLEGVRAAPDALGLAGDDLDDDLAEGLDLVADPDFVVVYPADRRAPGCP